MAAEYYNSVRVLHRDYQKHADKWKRVRNAISGDVTGYLRNVGKTESNAEYGARRQKEYEEGAVYYGFTKRTLDGMVGSVMRKAPEIIIPEKLQYLLDNADGSGVGLVQHAQDTLGEIDSVGRGGILVDTPATEVSTMAEQNAGILNPVISFYCTENIRYWRMKRYGSVSRVEMVILHEEFEYNEDNNEFNVKLGEQFRVLDVYEGRYRQRLFRFDTKGTYMETGYEEYFPVINAATPDEIPFVFIGATNNDQTIDEPPLSALAALNIGHFRNSADNEEASFVSGQPTLFVMPGESMSPQIFKDLNPEGIRLGSRMGVNLGYGGNAMMVQANATSLPFENMRRKEEQAVQIGAQLITPTSQITAESARIQRGADTSVMATVAKNVSAAYTKALQWAADMIGATGEIEFTLNMDFFLQPMTAQDRTAWMSDINAGYLPITAYYAALRRSGVTDWTDEDIEDALENQAPKAVTTEVTGDIPADANQGDGQRNEPDDEQA